MVNDWGVLIILRMLVEVLVAAIGILATLILYFVKKTFDQVGPIGADVAEMKPKVDILWKDKIAPAHSPRQLNPRGEDILAKSGIKKVIEEKKEALLDLIKQKNPTNPYDAEEVIENITLQLPGLFPETVEPLKKGAFQTGTDINTVLFVGSIYLRNIIFSDLGFSVNDLDKPHA